MRFSPVGRVAPVPGQPDLDDLLAQMFGGAAGAAAPGRARGADPFSGFSAPRGPRPGADVQARTTLSFRDAVEGATVTLQTAEGRRITTKVPAGVKDGQKIRLRGKGAEGDPGAPKGDLILTVAVDKHPVFGRDGDNLTVDLPVTFAEAALGATVVGADPRRHPGARQGRARAPRAAGCCGSRATASPAGTAPATCSPG